MRKWWTHIWEFQPYRGLRIQLGNVGDILAEKLDGVWLQQTTPAYGHAGGRGFGSISRVAVAHLRHTGFSKIDGVSLLLHSWAFSKELGKQGKNRRLGTEFQDSWLPKCQAENLQMDMRVGRSSKPRGSWSFLHQGPFGNLICALDVLPREMHGSVYVHTHGVAHPWPYVKNPAPVSLLTLWIAQV